MWKKSLAKPKRFQMEYYDPNTLLQQDILVNGKRKQAILLAVKGSKKFYITAYKAETEDTERLSGPWNQPQ